MFIDSASSRRPEIREVTVSTPQRCEVKASHILESEGEMMAPNSVWITHLFEFIVLKQTESVTTSSNTSVQSVQMFSKALERTSIQIAIAWGLKKKHFYLCINNHVARMAKMFVLFSF
jgi:hypothetical protein